MLKLYSSLVGLLTGSFANAAVFTLPVLDPSQVDPVFNVLAATAVYRSLEPPSHLSEGGRRFGFWLNLRATLAETTVLSSILQTNMSILPFGSIQAGINGPFGLGVEFGFLPSPSISGTSFSSFGGDIKWNFTNVFLKQAPFSAAVRILYSSATLNYQQTLLGVPVTVDYDTHIYGGTLDVSKVFAFFEPYIGYGFLSHSSTLSGSGTVAIFNTNFPVNTNTVNESGTSGWFRAGFEARLWLVALGTQYDYSFGTNTFSVKFGFKY